MSRIDPIEALRWVTTFRNRIDKSEGRLRGCFSNFNSALWILEDEDLAPAMREHYIEEIADSGREIGHHGVRMQEIAVAMMVLALRIARAHGELLSAARAQAKKRRKNQRNTVAKKLAVAEKRRGQIKEIWPTLEPKEQNAGGVMCALRASTGTLWSLNTIKGDLKVLNLPNSLANLRNSLAS